MKETASPLVSSIIHAIGRTPLVELNQIKKAYSLEGRLLAKCEYLNPGFSKKDRIALENPSQEKATGFRAEVTQRRLFRFWTAPW